MPTIEVEGVGAVVEATPPVAVVYQFMVAGTLAVILTLSTPRYQALAIE